METQPTTGEKKGFLQNDRVLVCGMLAVYGVCILIAVGAAFWGLNRRNQQVRANETATAVAGSTQQAQATATAAVRLTEQAGYDYVETFDKASKGWFVGSENDDLGIYSASIKDGLYMWDITDTKGYTQSSDVNLGSGIKDFDAYVDVKFAESQDMDSACAGMFFRKSSMGWEDGAYIFYICNGSHFEINFYQNSEWQEIQSSRCQKCIDPEGWNRIEISARGDRFTFFINNVLVYEMTDDRRQSGKLGLDISVHDGLSAEIWFDNFGFQRR